jgi:crotonobetainyl-CoA:carnitine CoA-transferase CaiB-like acyl-CoA transferase
LVKSLEAKNIPCAPILGVAEALYHPQTVARGLIVQGLAPNGHNWPHVPTPIRISGVPAAKLRAAGRLYDDHESLAKRFGLASRAKMPSNGALA